MKSILDAIAAFIAEHKLADIINLVGLVISILGFAGTIVVALLSKRSADAAKEAADNTQKELRRLDTVMDFTSVITLMEEIKQHHRSGYWNILPDRYSTLRTKLIGIKGGVFILSDGHMSVLQTAIRQFKLMEQRVEQSLSSGAIPGDSVKLNRIVSDQIDNLNEVMTEIKRQMEGQGNGK